MSNPVVPKAATRQVTVEIDDRGGGLFSATFCEQVGIIARWNGKRWVCQVHKTSKCLATFRNEDIWDRAVAAETIRAKVRDWPTPAEIRKHKRWVESTLTYHSIQAWIKEPLDMKRWEELGDRIEKALDPFKHIGPSMGPIPYPEDEGV